jgi:hypothetical protein
VFDVIAKDFVEDPAIRMLRLSEALQLEEPKERKIGCCFIS